MGLKSKNLSQKDRKRKKTLDNDTSIQPYYLTCWHTLCYSVLVSYGFATQTSSTTSWQTHTRIHCLIWSNFCFGTCHFTKAKYQTIYQWWERDNKAALAFTRSNAHWRFSIKYKFVFRFHFRLFYLPQRKHNTIFIWLVIITPKVFI